MLTPVKGRRDWLAVLSLRQTHREWHIEEPRETQELLVS